RAPYTAAKILVAGDNFGCGSSRQHAPWALMDFGIRCIIAPSFADIFYNNCFKNGMLPIGLPQADVDRCMAWAHAGASLTIDLTSKKIMGPAGEMMTFEVDDFRRDCLLKGLDDIGLTEQHNDKIGAFEAAQKQSQPWLWA
ncbi:MAG: 3-isopropylmalate dehydratase small subunit, partial [Alphaproteobacteria bacterium]|nr:3-isopropylmalate dehydratase small subunit [Alphaproteobacteria bacterium]